MIPNFEILKLENSGEFAYEKTREFCVFFVCSCVAPLLLSFNYYTVLFYFELTFRLDLNTEKCVFVKKKEREKRDDDSHHRTAYSGILALKSQENSRE